MAKEKNEETVPTVEVGGKPVALAGATTETELEQLRQRVAELEGKVKAADPHKPTGNRDYEVELFSKTGKGRTSIGKEVVAGCCDESEAIRRACVKRNITSTHQYQFKVTKKDAETANAA